MFPYQETPKKLYSYSKTNNLFYSWMCQFVFHKQIQLSQKSRATVYENVRGFDKFKA